MRAFVFLLFALMLACAERPNLTIGAITPDGATPEPTDAGGEPDAATETDPCAEVEGTTTATAVDVVLVVDDHIESEHGQDVLSQNLERVRAELPSNLDVRFGWVRPQMSGDIKDGVRTLRYDEDSPVRVRETGTPQPDCVSTGRAYACLQPIRNFSTLAEDVGTCRRAYEDPNRGLSAATEAVIAPFDANCAADFLRPHADTVLVFLSGQDDRSFRAPLDYANTWLRLKPAHKIRVVSIVGAVAGEAADCAPTRMGSCGSICDYDRNDLFGAAFQLHFNECAYCSFFGVADCCESRAGSRYVEFAQNLEAAVEAEQPDFVATGCDADSQVCRVLSICADDYGDTLLEMIVPPEPECPAGP